MELAGKIQMMPGTSFSSQLKSLISDRLNSAKDQKAHHVLFGPDREGNVARGGNLLAHETLTLN